jgi:hypothetical protein
LCYADDDAFDREIAGDGLNAIVWMAAARDLVVGTIKEEFVISSSNGKALSNTRNKTSLDFLPGITQIDSILPPILCLCHAITSCPLSKVRPRYNQRRVCYILV